MHRIVAPAKVSRCDRECERLIESKSCAGECPTNGQNDRTLLGHFREMLSRKLIFLFKTMLSAIDFLLWRFAMACHTRGSGGFGFLRCDSLISVSNKMILFIRLSRTASECSHTMAPMKPVAVCPITGISIIQTDCHVSQRVQRDNGRQRNAESI